MNESQNKKTVIVGIFVLIGLVFFALGILVIGNLRNTFSSKLHLMTFFDDVGGLQRGGNIWFSGVKVGIVKEITFFNRSKVQVVMNIEQNARKYLRRDSRVKLSSEGLIGNKILVIYGGSYSAGEVYDGDTLKADKSVSQEEMLIKLQENNENLLEITSDLKTISNKVVNGKGNIGRLIEDEDIYHNVASASRSLKEAAERSKSVVSSIAKFTDGLNRSGSLAYGLVNDTAVYAGFKKTLKDLESVADSASVLVNNLRQASSNTATPAGVLLHDEEAGAALKKTIKRLESGSEKLDEDLEALQHSFLLRKYFRKKDKKEKK